MKQERVTVETDDLLLLLVSDKVTHQPALLEGAKRRLIQYMGHALGIQSPGIPDHLCNLVTFYKESSRSGRMSLFAERYGIPEQAIEEFVTEEFQYRE